MTLNRILQVDLTNANDILIVYSDHVESAINYIECNMSG